MQHGAHGGGWGIRERSRSATRAGAPVGPVRTLRPAVNALAPEAVAEVPASHRALKTAAEDPRPTIRRSPARYR